MQLEKHNKTPNLKALLTTATCALLGSATNSASAQDNWELDTALMYYGESDRVTAIEAIIAGQKTYDNDEVLSLKLTLDSLTGASANGAVAQPQAQTFTRPSGNGSYTENAGKTPLDDTFKDTRLQLTGQWTQPLTYAEFEDYTLSIGGNVSKEYDYLSVSINGNLARDLNNKNTTLSAGLAYSFDKIEPEGGIPKPLATMVIGDNDSETFEQAFEQTRIRADDDKKTLDLLLGLTQVINRRMIVQLNYSYSSVDGYTTDPFKVISVVDSEGYTQRYLYENRPNERVKHAFFGQAKYHFESTILDASYRFMTDDWEIDSHTIDLRYYIPLSRGHYIEPHVRYYTQSAAEFYQPFLIQGQVTPTYVSADYRIGDMNAYTLGIKYGMPLNSGDRLAFRVEYYKQSPKSNGTNAIGVLNDVELYEEINAVIAQITYSF
ncbi:DUF3570 domain-containing protein [Thalassotalea atypica]|uniref:DUF3570 domain-containing protein n=1 Tax=Thalassotalea atypica TaxID=2054316 RepID=UPI0025736BD1|nr:DUF3570 domain-containing protein [Thalassotalea atypica]